MSRLAATFAHLRQVKRRALIGYLTVGYPALEDTLTLVPVMVAAGCDIIELGIPFSDPLADGTTIQRAGFRALQNGVTPAFCLATAARLRALVDVPLLFMTYYNSVFHYGLRQFCADGAAAGIDGLIVPDLPPEEGADLEGIAQEHKLDLVYLLAPTSSPERIQLVAARSRGFIYLVSLTGVTGAREELPPHLEEFVKRVRGIASQPLCVGFGISTPAQAERVAKVADGIIVGSRIIQLIESSADLLASLQTFLRSLRAVL
ncbi:MAG: tryptophan synthase subunit alpha [Chloroflexi bacterium]|nr:tryptophan synthase subunit alpha [Chloroflexota bacterium]